MKVEINDSVTIITNEKQLLLQMIHTTLNYFENEPFTENESSSKNELEMNIKNELKMNTGNELEMKPLKNVEMNTKSTKKNYYIPKGTPTVLNTKFGKAYLDKRSGYYTIQSKPAKQLHRVIFEDFYGEIPEGYIIHHKNNNRLDNCILNLQLMPRKEHNKLHNGNLEYGLKTSRLQNTTGYFRVTKQSCKKCKQGFTYRYQYYDKNRNKKSIYGKTINKLRKKVISKGLHWEKLI